MGNAAGTSIVRVVGYGEIGPNGFLKTAKLPNPISLEVKRIRTRKSASVQYCSMGRHPGGNGTSDALPLDRTCRLLATLSPDRNSSRQALAS